MGQGISKNRKIVSFKDWKGKNEMALPPTVINITITGPGIICHRIIQKYFGIQNAFVFIDPAF